jgi:hypothetical protein
MKIWEKIVEDMCEENHRFGKAISGMCYIAEKSSEVIGNKLEFVYQYQKYELTYSPTRGNLGFILEVFTCPNEYELDDPIWVRIDDLQKIAEVYRFLDSDVPLSEHD